MYKWPTMYMKTSISPALDKHKKKHITKIKTENNKCRQGCRETGILACFRKDGENPRCCGNYDVSWNTCNYDPAIPLWVTDPEKVKGGWVSKIYLYVHGCNGTDHNAKTCK